MPENKAVPSEQVKKLKRRLEVWREAVLPLHAVLVWEKPWHPGLLVGISSTFFLLFWYLDPSVLTTLAFIGLVMTVGDYIIHLFGSYDGRPESNEKWTGNDEKKLTEVCQNIASIHNLFSKNLSYFFGMRHTHPKTYYASTIILLIILSWLGSVISNLFLTYIVVTLALLLPGVKQHGICWSFSGKDRLLDKIMGDKKSK